MEASGTGAATSEEWRAAAKETQGSMDSAPGNKVGEQARNTDTELRKNSAPCNLQAIVFIRVAAAVAEGQA